MVFSVQRDKNIKVSEQTYKVLKKLKNELELRSFDAVVRILIRLAIGKRDKLAEIAKETLEKIISENKEKKEKL